MIREFGHEQFSDWDTSVETEVSVKGIGKVDVVGRIGDATIAIECGRTNQKKVFALKKHFDVVLHIPYCYTWNLININKEEINHQVFVAMIKKELKRRKLPPFKKGKVFCLEEGECSLPSGRDGFPEEAMQIAGLLTINQAKKKN